MLHWTAIYLLSEWVIRLIMLVYVPQRRSPAAARTWLLLIFVLPWPGLILYAIFGRPYVPSNRRRMQERISQTIRTTGQRYFQPCAIHPELPPQFLRAVTLAKNLGDFPILGGNEVELLNDYDGTIERLIADIDLAGRHVHLLYYIFADDRTGHRVADALLRAVSRGVTCRVLIDSLGSKGARRSLAPRMRAGGVEVLESLPVRLLGRDRARFDLRNHRKIAVIDGQVAYVGSQNLVDADFKAPIVYEELVARVTGPVCRQLQAVYLADRFLETGQPLHDAEFFPEPVASSGDIAAQILPSGPSYSHANNQRLIVALVHAAQERVVMTTPYFIPDEPLLQAMQTAVLRGVAVHLIVSQAADQFLVCFAQRSYYEDLLAAGIAIHVYQPRFLHAKHLTIDDSVALVGSSNFDLRSFLLNEEVSLLVYDPRVVARLRDIQQQAFAASHKITLDEWRRRPLVTKTVQNIARLVDSLL